MKTCNKCRVEKPLDQFNKQSNAKDGRRYSCRACDAAYHVANREKILVRQKAYGEANRDKVSARGKAWREANRGKERARGKAYAKANPDKRAAIQKAYRDANPDKRAASHKAYYKANPDKFAAATRRRQAAKLQRTPPWLTRDHNHQMIQMYAERDRLTKETGVEHHVDHIVPLRGKNISGLHVPWNLQVITAHENQTKNNRWSEA